MHPTGSIAVGRRADLAVWADDPVTYDADDLIENDVLLTAGDGEVAHRALD